MDKDDFFAGTGGEGAEGVEIGGGSEDADGVLEALHVDLGDNGVGGVGTVEDAQTPCFVAYLCEHGKYVFGLTPEEYGAGDVGLFGDGGLPPLFFADDLYGVEEFGEGTHFVVNLFAYFFVSDAFAKVHGVPFRGVGEELVYGSHPFFAPFGTLFVP